MLKLLFELSGKPYSIDVSQVLEVLPVVPLEPVTGSPEYMNGLLQYRGSAVPVIDLRRLIAGQPAPKKLSTRIIIIDASKNGSTKRPLGLICEKVTDTTQKNQKPVADDIETVLPRSMYDFLFDFGKR